jgi:hypothetical protein
VGFRILRLKLTGGSPPQLGEMKMNNYFEKIAWGILLMSVAYIGGHLLIATIK